MIVALVLVSALLHATWNALLRIERDKDRTLIAAVSAATLLAFVVAGIRCALGAMPFSTVESGGWATAAGVLEWLYFVALARALDLGRLGVVYTVTRGGAIVLVWPLSIALLSEHVTALGAIGSAVVLLGLGVTSLSTAEHRKAHGGALAWSLACACAIAGYHVAYKEALRTGGNPSAVFACALAVATGINVARIGTAGRRIVIDIITARPARIALMGLVVGSSFLILMEALSRGGAGFVLTLRNTSVLFAVTLAFLIGERPHRTEIIGALLVAAGAILMAW